MRLNYDRRTSCFNRLYCNRIRGIYWPGQGFEIMKAILNRMSKQCFNCKKYKDLNEFYVDRRRKDGVASLCKICNKEKVREWKKKHYHRMAAAAELYRADNVQMPFSQYVKELKADGRY